MTNQFFNSNRKSISFLASIVVLILVNGIVGFAIHNQYRTENEQNARLIRDTRDVQLAVQMQFQMIKNILLDTEHQVAYRRYFYRLSKYSSSIQDRLFNLKNATVQDKDLSARIGRFRVFHEKTTQRCMALIHNEAPGDIALLLLDSYEEAAADEIAVISESITMNAERQISRITYRYYSTAVILFVIQLVVSLVLCFHIIAVTKRNQKEVLALTDKLNSYLPPQLIRSIIRNKGVDGDRISRKFVTVCFTDLSGFTALTENYPAEIISAILDEYLVDMSTIVHAWGGMIDKFIGDGIMITFGAIEHSDSESHAVRCVAMAVAMQNRLQELNQKWEKQGSDFSLSLRIGINSGYAAVGSFGPDERRVFTVIGSVVNKASRIESLCVPGRILIGSATNDLIGATVKTYPVVKENVKGLKEPLLLYEIRDKECNFFKNSNGGPITDTSRIIEEKQAV